MSDRVIFYSLLLLGVVLTINGILFSKDYLVPAMMMFVAAVLHGRKGTHE